MDARTKFQLPVNSKFDNFKSKMGETPTQNEYKSIRPKEDNVLVGLLLVSCIVAMAIFFWKFPTFPFAIIVAGYFILFLIGNVFNISGTLVTAIYWISIDVISLIILVFRTGIRELKSNAYIETLLGVFLVFIVVNWIFVADFSPYGAKKIGYFTLMSLLPFFMTKWIRTKKLSNNTISIIAIISFVLSLVTVLLYFLGVGRIGDERYTMIESWRPINSAMASGISVLSICWWSFSQTRLKKIIASIIVAMVGLVAMYLTSQRGPLISLVLTLIIAPPVLVSLLSKKKVIITLLFMCLICIGYFINPSQRAQERFDKILTSPRSTQHQPRSTVDLRIIKYKQALLTGYENILTGKGFGYTKYAHNAFLEIWEETGIMGIILYLSITGSCIYCIFRRRRNDLVHGGMNTEDPGLLWQSLFVFSFVEGMFSMTVFGNTLLWVSLGMIMLRPQNESRFSKTEQCAGNDAALTSRL